MTQTDYRNFNDGYTFFVEFIACVIDFSMTTYIIGPRNIYGNLDT